MYELIEALLPPDLGMGVVALLLGASFVGGLISAAFGLGGGLMMLAVLGSVLPPAALIPIHGVVQLGSNVGRGIVLWRHISWSILPPFIAGSLVGASVGGLTVVNIPAAGVQVGVGVFILWSIFASPPAILRKMAWLTGLISSFLTMFFGASAPFVIAYTKGLSLGRMGQVGTHAAMMTSQHILKTLVFGFLGFSFGPWLGLVAGLIATGFLGTVAGQQILIRTKDDRFAKILNGILLLLALRLIYVGMTDFLGQ